MHTLKNFRNKEKPAFVDTCRKNSITIIHANNACGKGCIEYTRDISTKVHTLMNSIEYQIFQAKMAMIEPPYVTL